MNSNILTVYSKTSCPQCDKAMQFLTGHEIPFKTVKIDQDPASREFLMNEGHRAVPQLYLNDKLFVEGGWNGLSKLTKEEIQGKLASN